MRNATRLHRVCVAQFVERDVTEGWEFSSGSHRAGDPARFCFRRVIRRDPFRETRRAHVHVVRLIADAVLGEVDRRAVERVGFDNVATDFEKRAVNVFHRVGTSDEQILVTALETRAAEIVERQVLHLEIGAHCAVEDDDAFF